LNNYNKEDLKFSALFLLVLLLLTFGATLPAGVLGGIVTLGAAYLGK